MARWSVIFSLVLSITNLVASYRPVQHCRQLFENGHYSACTALTQHYNQTSGESDLYIRYHWYKYKDSKNGWHAVALGPMMAGALMFIMYGDPTTPNPVMTLSVRSAEGHRPPSLVSEMDAFTAPVAKGRVPSVDIVTSTFRTYTGPYEHPELKIKPTHVGVGEFIVRGYRKWIGAEVSNTTTNQPMLWSSRHDQDFQEDYSIDHGIEAHAFGLGFGFIYADLLNAETPIPMFGPIDELAGHKGIVEIGDTTPPTAAELSAGEFAVSRAHLDVVNADLGKAPSNEENNPENNPFNDHDTTPSTVPDKVEGEEESNSESTAPETSTPSTTTEDQQAQAVYTIRGKTIRDWMWHLHGFLLCVSFFILYPMGIYLLRSPKQIAAGTSFNHHWTVQSLATVCFSIGCFIGFLQSRSISVTHQYVGLFIVFSMGTQIVLGWRHHVKFVQVKRKTLMSKIHVGMGRVIMPLGFINILSGLKLRQYGWFTMLLVLVLIIIEVVFGAIFLRGAHVRRAKMGGAAVAEQLKAQGPGKDDDAEEYFQLAGEDELSDLSDNEEAADKQRERKREENARLAKLDRV